MKLDGGKEKDAKCGDYYRKKEVGAVERLEGEHAEKVESRALFQEKQARERLIELAKSQEG